MESTQKGFNEYDTDYLPRSKSLLNVRGVPQTPVISGGKRDGEGKEREMGRESSAAKQRECSLFGSLSTVSCQQIVQAGIAPACLNQKGQGSNVMTESNDTVPP